MFVAFKTEEELSQHNYIFHQRGGIDKKKQKEQNLLGFKSNEGSKKEKEREEIKFKDNEAIDFGW